MTKRFSKIENDAKGQIWYGLHFYPGVAEYHEPDDKEPYRIFISEKTLRQMDPTFAGCPVFVQHVDEIEQNIDDLRQNADGWVIESFFNEADGKHWVKFVVVSENGSDAIRKGWGLSNCYIPKKLGPAGKWNNVSYAKEITEGQYEHLAIVSNPRYEESFIMSPDAFKDYNQKHREDLKKLSNTKGINSMKLKFFEKKKVENDKGVDVESLSVLLPKSGKEKTISQLVNEVDEMEMKGNKCNMSDMVDVEGVEMSVEDLLKKHKAIKDELEALKAKPEEEEEVEDEEDELDEEEVEDVEEDALAKDKALEIAEHEEEEIAEAKKQNELEKKRAEKEKKKKSAEKAERLRNAHKKVTEEVARVDLAEDRVARGKARYGSGN